MTVGERIKFFRKTYKITQKTFALKLGISQTHISKIENNQDNPSDSLLHLIAANCSINYEWLATGEGEMGIGASDFKENISLNQCLYRIQQLENEISSYDYHSLLSQIMRLLDISDVSRNFRYMESGLITRSLDILFQMLEYLSAMNKEYSYHPSSITSSDECAQIENDIYSTFGTYLDSLNQSLKEMIPMVIASWDNMQNYIAESADE